MSLTSGGQITPGSLGTPTPTVTPSAGPGGPINYNGSINTGAAATAASETARPAPKTATLDGMATTGTITQQNIGSPDAAHPTIEPPREDKVTPQSALGTIDKTPPGTGADASPAHPKTGLGRTI